MAQATSNPEIVDIDRIEVLRGPQGTYFGRNAVGGAINITTKQPTNDFFAEASAQYSSFNTVDSHGILNLPLIDHLLAVRMVGEKRTATATSRTSIQSAAATTASTPTAR